MTGSAVSHPDSIAPVEHPSETGAAGGWGLINTTACEGTDPVAQPLRRLGFDDARAGGCRNHTRHRQSCSREQRCILAGAPSSYHMTKDPVRRGLALEFR
jgi:hypothetical protein